MMKTTDKATVIQKMIKAYSASLFSAALLGLPGLASAKVTNFGEMVDVPSGSFTMGCLNSNDDICYYAEDEKAHKVYLNAYKIDKYEVTFARYKKCLDAGKCSPLAVGGSMNFGRKGVDNFPINGVTWHQAKAFCEFEGKRLPTEAEWEKAARGTDKRFYPWGNKTPSCSLATISDKTTRGKMEPGCGMGTSRPVNANPEGASPYGVMGMTSNHLEWTSDWYDAEYYKKNELRDPKGADRNTGFKTLRGATWMMKKEELDVSIRVPYAPEGQGYIVGFRCAG